MVDWQSVVTQQVQCDWCKAPEMAETVARFFVANADPAYISHSELQFGRAVAVGHWAEDLPARVRGEALRAIAYAAEGGALTGSRLALAVKGDVLCGLAFVSFNSAGQPPFATLEDLMVDAATRAHGVGTLLFKWIDAQCQAGGFHRLFLESGLGNAKAHEFFERQGFVQTSIVMMRARADQRRVAIKSRKARSGGGTRRRPE